MRIKLLFLVLFFTFSVSLFSINIKFDATFLNDQIYRKDYFDKIQLELDIPLFSSTHYKLGAGFIHDGQRISGWEDELLGHRWYNSSGYFFHESDKLTLKLGLQSFSIGLGNEYSLFFRKDVGSFNGLSLRWSPSNYFTFRDSLILVRFAPYGVVGTEGDKGFSKSFYHRSYTFNYADFSFGFHDSILFIDRNFDPWYAFSILPYTAVQEIRHMSGPEKERINDNAMVGAFISYEPGKLRLYTDLLIDDINANAVLNPSNQTVTKLAINAGADYNAGYLTINIEGAISSAYVFARTNASLPYEHSKGEKENVEDYIIEENMLGYKYGENSSSIILKFEHEIGLYGSYENVLIGTREPWNPWHGEPTYEQGTNFFLGGVNETRNILKIGFKKNFTLLSLFTNVNAFCGICITSIGNDNNYLPLLGISISVDWK
ncbi:MAG: hypothetical protein FXF54_00750 [Kosmotoga sp.]|nr:MAG: hypothetical protein FXF54_00750 [Kosmotoga sp.]